MRLRALLGSLALLLVVPASPVGAEGKSTPAPKPPSIRECVIGGAMGHDYPCLHRASRMGPRPAVSRNATILSDPRCMRRRKTICIDLGARALYAVRNERVVKAFPTRTGRRGFETRQGVHHVYWLSKNHVSSIYHSPMPYSVFFSGGQAIHFSQNFADVGYKSPGSYGCSNIRSRSAARWIYRWVRIGTPVVVTT